MNNYKVKMGEYILHDGKKMYVSEVICQGVNDRTLNDGSIKKGTKAYICACPVMPDNGQIRHRSPRCIGTDWEHVES